MDDPSPRDPVRDAHIALILVEAWDRFHPAILWWANREAATHPVSADHVYRALLSGPPGAIELAVSLRKAIQDPLP